MIISPEIDHLYIIMSESDWIIKETIVNTDGTTLYILKNGDMEWRKYGWLHRDNGPAIEKNGVKMWYHCGRLHRIGGPAIECEYIEWYRDGRLHREDGPAIERVNGDREWYKNGHRHREDGPAIERVNGDREWYKSGHRHREDGPAIESANGDREWYMDGFKCHGDDPASIQDFQDCMLTKDDEWEFEFFESSSEYPEPAPLYSV